MCDYQIMTHRKVNGLWKDISVVNYCCNLFKQSLCPHMFLSKAFKLQYRFGVTFDCFRLNVNPKINLKQKWYLFLKWDGRNSFKDITNSNKRYCTYSYASWINNTIRNDSFYVYRIQYCFNSNPDKALLIDEAMYDKYM